MSFPPRRHEVTAAETRRFAAEKTVFTASLFFIDLLRNTDRLFLRYKPNDGADSSYQNRRPCGRLSLGWFYFNASSIATATATVMPTIGLLPAPIRPIISTCAGTEEEPANCASECILPIVSVMP